MKIQVAVPSYNEELTVAKVVRDFRVALPEAEVVVYDNNSNDRTVELASQAGARVVRVNRQGKGHVVQAIFELSEADITVMVDGDDTYEAGDVRQLIQPLLAGDVDMTIGTRLHSDPASFPQMHRLGNRFLTCVLNTIFRSKYHDILSGYRAFSRSFIETVPLISTGFEVETELAIQALENDIAVKEIPIRYRNRPSGSVSKLSSFKDGYQILLLIISLLRDHRPFFLFTTVGVFLFVIGSGSWLLGVLYSPAAPQLSFLRSGGVVLVVLSVGLFLIGLVLNTINTRMRELGSLIRRRRLSGDRDA
jgi:glycosyltransferase involved in cell wall biosynthesis